MTRYSNANMRFESFVMPTTVQPFFLLGHKARVGVPHVIAQHSHISRVPSPAAGYSANATPRKPFSRPVIACADAYAYFSRGVAR